MKDRGDLLKNFEQVRTSASPFVDRALVPVVSIHQHVPVPTRRARQKRGEADHPVMVGRQDAYIRQPVMPDAGLEFRNVRQAGVSACVTHSFHELAMLFAAEGELPRRVDIGSR
jgi:hypothetical protein